MSKKNVPNVDLHYHGGNSELIADNGTDTGKKKKEKKTYN